VLLNEIQTNDQEIEKQNKVRSDDSSTVLEGSLRTAVDLSSASALNFRSRGYSEGM